MWIGVLKKMRLIPAIVHWLGDQILVPGAVLQKIHSDLAIRFLAGIYNFFFSDKFITSRFSKTSFLLVPTISLSGKITIITIHEGNLIITYSALEAPYPFSGSRRNCIRQTTGITPLVLLYV